MRVLAPGCVWCLSQSRCTDDMSLHGRQKGRHKVCWQSCQTQSHKLVSSIPRLSHNNHPWRGNNVQTSYNCCCRTPGLPCTLHHHHVDLHHQVHHSLPLPHHRDSQVCSISCHHSSCPGISDQLEAAVVSQAETLSLDCFLELSRAGRNSHPESSF